MVIIASPTIPTATTFVGHVMDPEPVSCPRAALLGVDPRAEAAE